MHALEVEAQMSHAVRPLKTLKRRAAEFAEFDCTAFLCDLSVSAFQPFSVLKR
jgi:hypothetical protein